MLHSWPAARPASAARSICQASTTCAVGVAILRFFGTTPEVSRGSVYQQEQIARAVELGLGALSPDTICFVTGDADSAAYAARIMQALHGAGTGPG